MKVLHLCNGFFYNVLYKNLLLELAKKNIRQIVFAPLRRKLLPRFDLTPNEPFVTIPSTPIGLLDRLFFARKQKKLYNDLVSNVDNFTSIDITHAHTLFSDGAIALKLKKDFGISFIVAVRNTDVNIFFKYLIYLRKLGLEILTEAEQIVFLSPAYKDFLISKYVPSHLKQGIERKSVVIPNGIDDFWMNNIKMQGRSINANNLRFVYIGDFSSNKNIYTIIMALREYNKKYGKCELKIIGGGGNWEKRVETLCRKYNEFVSLYPRTNDREELLNYLAESDIFIMPSFYETFGLVYVEAMSQGVPSIYSKGQGIDGYFKSGIIGRAVTPDDISDIINEILYIIVNYDIISMNCLHHVKEFSWSRISDIYLGIYMHMQYGHQNKIR